MQHVSSPAHPYPAALVVIMVMVTVAVAIVVVVVVTVASHCYRCCGCVVVAIVDGSQLHPYLEDDPVLYVKYFFTYKLIAWIV